MQTIIQLSDFHIKSTMAEPDKNPVFVGLIRELKNMDLQNCIFLYNGDVIDSRIIEESINKSLSCEEKAKEWEIKAAEAYKLAELYFNYFTSELSIPRDKIIICCGNHDVNKYCIGEKDSIIKCTSKENTVLYSKMRFEQFRKFCDNIQSRKNTTGTYFRIIDNINFLVVNTNWVNKSSDGKQCNLCINCDEIQNLISERKNKLRITKDNKSKLHNVFVAHAPSIDYCEEALYAYEENSQHPIKKEIDYWFGLKLYGDKHTGDVHDFDYIVGAPLDSKHITCGIHIFDESFCHHYKSLIYSAGKWKIVGSENDIKEILDISKDSIKTQALQYLYNSKSTSELEKKILEFENVLSSERWNDFDQLIRNYAEIQRPQLKGSGKQIHIKNGFINTLTRLIADSSNKNCITMRGDVRLGKSVCVSLLYMNLLHRFACGTFVYLPIYINIEKIIENITRKNKRSSASTSSLNSFRNTIHKKLEQGITLAKKLQRPACCLIDGINKFYLYEGQNVEDIIQKELDSKIGKQYSRLIYCIDTGENVGLGSTPQDTQKNSDYIVYFNRLLTKKATSKKYKSFIKAFCALQNVSSPDNTSEIIFENISRMNIKEVDTNILINFWDVLSVHNDQSFFTSISEYVNKRIPNSKLSAAGQASFLYHNRGENYSKIQSKLKIDEEYLELIRTQKELAQYLLAANYVNELTKKESKIAACSCLNVLYNHDMCTLIREYIRTNNRQEQLIRFAKDSYKNLSFEGKATITFLLGRIANESPELRKILSEHQKQLDKEAKKDNFGNDCFYKIAQRSILLSNVFIDNNSNNIYKYIKTLISDEKERKINRIFYLHFYGDRQDCNEDIICEGFDIYYTYNILFNRLSKWKDNNKKYPLLELELFTLCDLIQIRIDDPNAFTKTKECVDSFFYNSKFNNPQDEMAINVINFMIEVTSKYIECYGNNDKNTIFIKYLSFQKEQYMSLIEKLSSSALSRNEDAYDPVYLLNKLIELENVSRIGWKIYDRIDKSIGDEDFKNLQNEGSVIETTLHHTYEAYLIGLLYLPKTSWESSEYCKQDILNMILIHDFGESAVGDIISQYIYSEKVRKEEREFCEKLFLQGIHYGIADLSDYFSLWEEWCDDSKNNYNIKIAQEIDKIQLIYKLINLLGKGELPLTKSRIEDFWNSRNEIRTPEGKQVFNLIIANNRSVQKIAEQNGLHLSKLL